VRSRLHRARSRLRAILGTAGLDGLGRDTAAA
jgi:DNA-directed RNA polymerase specialized sigma24 family protein